MLTQKAGTVKFSENLETANVKDESGLSVNRCMVRHAKITIFSKGSGSNSDFNVPYGANLNVSNGEKVKSGTILFQWDPYTDVILARQSGIVDLKDFIENETYQVEAVEGGKKQMVIVESKDRNLSPHVEIVNKEGSVLAGGTILPVTANLVVRKGDKVSRGQTLVKIPRAYGKTRDITGGLPRVTELFEARKPTAPAVVTEIDGLVKFGETKRGIRKIQVEGVDGNLKTYSIPYGKHVVVHEGDKITAGTSLCEGSISPVDILTILGPNKVREYLVDQIQEVYRLQGVKIDDKHIEVIVRQMMQKVSIDDTGDSHFLPKDRINRAEFFETNQKLQSMVFITDNGDSELEEETLVDKKVYQEINKALKEAYRVLKPGGRFMCLEFSKIENDHLNKLYKLYSKNIPKIGKVVVGDSAPYEYLLDSIDSFFNQDEFTDLMKKNNFYKTEYRNLSGGVVAIFSGWKI